MKRFVLIDGNAIMHRAFHALPDLSKNGEMVNAIYGFFSMFFKILDQIQPSFIAVCFDRPAPTFRKTLYAGYQATRPQMVDGLSSQIGRVHELLQQSGISIFEIDGYEADDLIGTLAVQIVQSQKTQNTQTSRQSDMSESQNVRNTGLSEFSEYSGNIEVIIVSGDRDLLQLVNSHVKMFAPVVGMTNTILYDEAKVEEKFGIKPSQIIDYKALVGDSSDNYPGVSGIGPKTASDLLRKYDTFENLYQHIGELSPKISERLATDAEQAALAKKLATIACDAPLTLDFEQCSILKFDKDKLKELFEELGFKSLVKRISEQDHKGTEETPLRSAKQNFEGQAKGIKGKRKDKKKEENQQLGLL